MFGMRGGWEAVRPYSILYSFFIISSDSPPPALTQMCGQNCEEAVTCAANEWVWRRGYVARKNRSEDVSTLDCRALCTLWSSLPEVKRSEKRNSLPLFLLFLFAVPLRLRHAPRGTRDGCGSHPALTPHRRSVSEPLASRSARWQLVWAPNLGHDSGKNLSPSP